MTTDTDALLAVLDNPAQWGKMLLKQLDAITLAAARIRTYREALRELVRLKNLGDEMVMEFALRTDESITADAGATERRAEYVRRLAAAWAEARRLAL